MSLERALHEAGLWPTDRPDARALASEAPFAIDSMAFNAWLAYVFIPKCRQLLLGKSMPSEMAITPAAELYMPHCPAPILAHLLALDTLTQRDKH